MARQGTYRPIRSGSPDPAAPSPLRVSVTEPFRDCTADSSPWDQFIQFSPESVAEPWVAVNPVDVGNIVICWQQDRRTMGSARGVMTAVTHDAGLSWRYVPLPGLTLCSGGSDFSATNAFLAYGADGTLHATAITIGGSPLSTAVVVMRSADGGLGWTAPTTVLRSPMVDYFNDKPAITIDPADPRRAYLVWNRNDIAEDRHELMTSRTTDGGSTWEPARAVHRPSGNGVGTVGNQIFVLPDGELVGLFMESGFPIGGDRVSGMGHSRIALIRSCDQGLTWSPAQSVATARPSSPTLTDTGTLVIAASIVPSAALDPATGALYVAWSDAGLSESQSAIALTVSRDGGRTWTAPRRVDGAADPGQAFRPQVDVADDGSVGVTYYELRSGSDADFCLAVRRGGRESWEYTRLGGPFDLGGAVQWFGGPFLGAYTGLAHVREQFVSAFVMAGTTGDHPQDVYVTGLPVGRGTDQD